MSNINEKMTSLADSIRAKSGESGKLSLDAMKTAVDSISVGIDTSDATADSDEILLNETAYVDGEKVKGTMPNNGTISSTMDGVNVKSITIPKGYTTGGSVALDNTIDNAANTQADLIAQISTILDTKAAGNGIQLPTLTNEGSAGDLLNGKQLIDGEGNIVTGTMATTIQATPSISVDANGKITAAATQTAGYVSAGTKSATLQLNTKGTTEIIPNKSVQLVVSANTYVTGRIKVDPIPSNYIEPSGTLNITESGTHDVKNYASVNVNVAGSGSASIETCTVDITANSGYTIYYTTVQNGVLTKAQKTGTGSITVVKNTYLYTYGYGCSISGADDLEEYIIDYMGELNEQGVIIYCITRNASIRIYNMEDDPLEDEIPLA